MRADRRSIAISFLILLTPLLLTGQFMGFIGEPLIVQGQVRDTRGRPIEGAVVELWQADRDGVYNHPLDSRQGTLLPDFQYFGVSTTDAEGTYVFLTEKPSPYGSRPSHLHLKVKTGGAEVLTTQLYFQEDILEKDEGTVEQEWGFADAGGGYLFLRPVIVGVLGSQGLRILTCDLVLDLNGEEPDLLSPTQAQTEGPYYPVVDFSGYDNDLTGADPYQEPVSPIPAIE